MFHSSAGWAALTAQGSALTRLRRVAPSGNPLLIEAAARECGRLPADDAFVVLIALAGDARRYEKASVRWVARYCQELTPPPDDVEAQLVFSAVRALGRAGAPGPATATALAGAEALAALFETRELRQAGRALDAWVERQS